MSNVEVMPSRLPHEGTEDLRRAIACLEGTSFAQRLTDAVGRPVSILTRAFRSLPGGRWRGRAKRRLRAALRVALHTIDLQAPPGPRAARISSPPPLRARSGALSGSRRCRSNCLSRR